MIVIITDDEQQFTVKNVAGVIRISNNATFRFFMSSSMNPEFAHMGSRRNLIGEEPSEDLIQNYSNELQIDAYTPPTFLIHSSDDKSATLIWPNSSSITW